MRSCVRVWNGYDLDSTLAPSFILPMYVREGERYVRIYGKRHTLVQVGSEVCCVGCSKYELLWYSGTWVSPDALMRGLKGRFKEVVEWLKEEVGPIGIAIDPESPLAVFYSAFLSKSTSYYSNTVRWLRELFNRAGGSEEELIQFNLRELGRSYQLSQLESIKYSVLGVLRESTKLDVFSLRRELLRLPYVGIKTAHAFLMFSKGFIRFPPVDRHFTKLLRELGVEAELPARKERCLKPCPSCPIRNKCAIWVASELFGPAAGWVQTATYLYFALRGGARGT